MFLFIYNFQCLVWSRSLPRFVMRSIYCASVCTYMLFASTVLNYRIHTFLRSDCLLSILGKIWSSTNLFTHEHTLSLCLNSWFNCTMVFRLWMLFRCRRSYMYNSPRQCRQNIIPRDWLLLIWLHTFKFHTLSLKCTSFFIRNIRDLLLQIFVIFH